MLWAVVGLLAAAGVAAAALFFGVCGRRKPKPPEGEDPLRVEKLRCKAWLEQRNTDGVWTLSDDELRLEGIHIQRRRPKGTVVLFHDCRSSWEQDFSGIVPFLWERGYRLVLTDARAHGASRGRFFTYGTWERFDVRSWANFAAERFGDTQPVFLYGAGMGATAALLAAQLELPGNVRGVIAEGGCVSPYADLQRRLSRHPVLPAGPALRVLNAVTTVFAGFGLKDADTLAAVQDTGYPILLLHGGADEITPAEDARRLHSACSADKRLWIVEGAGHGLCHVTDPEGMENAIGDFLDRYLI